MRHRPALRAVVAAPVIVPLRDTIALHILRITAIQFLREGQAQSVGVGRQGKRQKDLAAGVADALEAAVAHGSGLPAAQTDEIEVTIARAESSTAYAGEELQAQVNRSALHHAVDLLPQHEHDAAATVGEVQQVAAERSPAVARHP